MWECIKDFCGEVSSKDRSKELIGDGNITLKMDLTGDGYEGSRWMEMALDRIQ
jgi:hypothetical protein